MSIHCRIASNSNSVEMRIYSSIVRVKKSVVLKFEKPVVKPRRAER